MDAGILLRKILSPAGRRDPWPLYASLHALGQVNSLPQIPGSKMCAVVNGYEAVGEVLRDVRFVNLDRGNIADSRPDWEEHPFYTTLMGTIMFSNAAEHSRFRRLFGKVFTPRRVTAMEPAITALIDARLDGMAAAGADGGEIDFMTEFAYPVPAGVVGQLLGIPEADWAWVPPRTDLINEALNMRVNNAKVLEAADRATQELVDYYLELIARLRAEPGDDVTSGLIQEIDAGTHVSDLELACNLVVTYNAAFSTTTPMFAAALVELLERPEQAARMRDVPEAAGPLVEEILRYQTSVHFVSRSASEDLTVHGVDIPKGGTILVMLGAANRDPKRFADPDVFDPDRPENNPISFGVGPHYCLGAALSRREGALAMPRLLRRFPKLAIGANPQLNDSILLPSYLSLPVTLF
ncbi:cytochrome P450 [Longispora fulva]|uniref:Cytochrome P450 n=1 Tax=Longispora fulva TaxID=619741 RepID=A0A8J7KJZ5_9ACTN|nr:cytochrome P450 [Longispora fulva]MBG6137449.1 cytochrome P450 [Longispora fulva]GIG61196.1 cytochrome P450 [Longispora fulva]